MPAASAALSPDGAFEHVYSGTAFSILSNSGAMKQSFIRPDESSTQSAAFVIGSGNHAYGYLIQVGRHIFQSPLSYYTNKHLWDVAPGYELDRNPDFTRPVTVECLFCHSGKSMPVADSLNTFQTTAFDSYGISCERCHGDTAAHLKNPVAGSIVNPAKLAGSVRASLCEECHLTGETRIPNPGKSITDFMPGHALEDFYTTYVRAKSSGENIKVVSHVEQLALSECARKSGDRLWCGTCHEVHDKPAQPAAYFRDKCLSCHRATLAKAHAAPDRDCVACHMQKLPARDGGHTAFTNHRIETTFTEEANAAEPDTLTAWRDPEPHLRERNLALALVAGGLQNQSSAEVIRGYKMMNRLIADFPDDEALLTSLGSVLMKGKEPAEALKCFRRVIALKPSYAPFYVNAATALLATNQLAEAIQQLEKAVTLDSLLQEAVQLLCQAYREQGEPEKARERLARYDHAMSITRH
jgi:hypothetical protein